MRAMKDSGIEWIGQIPQEWSTVKVKFTGNYQSGNSITASAIKERGEFPVYGGNGLRGYTDHFTHNGSHILIGRQGALCGNVHLVNGMFWASEHAVVGKIADNYNIRYIYYLLDVFNLNRLSTTAAQPGISVEQIVNVIIPKPPKKSIQLHIADFLDTKCAEIDALIAAKEKTNALLKERRQSIIYEAVTKGLNPDAPMKDSGIEWIGEMPEHWSAWRMKHLASEPLQYGANATGVEFRDDIPRYVRITDITADRKLSNEGKQSLEMENARDYMLEDGDILFARSGATSGKSFYYESLYGPCCFAGYLIRLRTDSRKVLSKFLYYYTLTQAYENWTQQIFIQATIQNISADKYNNLWFAIPGSLEEQKEIVDYLDQRCSEMDELIFANDATIQKLKEYRQSIIYEAVTGKIDV